MEDEQKLFRIFPFIHSFMLLGSVDSTPLDFNQESSATKYKGNFSISHQMQRYANLILLVFR